MPRIQRAAGFTPAAFFCAASKLALPPLHRVSRVRSPFLHCPTCTPSRPTVPPPGEGALLSKQRAARAAAGIIVSLLGALASIAAPPDDFPQFIVPGHEAEMESLRNLFWLHYANAGP